MSLELIFPSLFCFLAAVINVTFESPNYTVTEGSGNPAEVCVRADSRRIKTQQQLNITVVITPVMSGMSLPPVNFST